MTYNAFISYSHAADGKLAPALQSGLHRFARPWYRMRALHVFRDETNLSVNPALWPAIERALNESEFFVLLASPSAAASKWVRKEVEHWLGKRSPQTLLIILTDGELTWDEAAGSFNIEKSTALPSLLGNVFRDEPLHLDLRWAKNATQLSRRHPAFQDAIARLAATLHKRSKDQLIGDDVRQHRRTRTIAAAAGVAILTFGALAAWQARVATVQRDSAIARELAIRASSEQSETVSLLLAVESLRHRPTLEGQAVSISALSRVPRPIAWLRHPGAVNAVAFSPDERWLATAGAGGVRLWNAANGEAAVGPDYGAFVNDVAFSGNGARLYTASTDSTVRGWDTADWDEAVRLYHGAAVQSVAVSTDGAILASTSGDTARVWQVANRRQLVRVGSDAIALSASGEVFAAFLDEYGDTPVHVWRVRSATKRQYAVLDSDGDRVLALSPNGRYLAAGTNTGVVKLHDLLAGEAPLRRYHRGDWGEVSDLAFSPDGRFFATASNDQSSRTWEVPSGRLIGRMEHGVLGHVNRVVISGDGRLVASSSVADVVHVWDAWNGKEVAQIPHGASAVALDRGGHRVATAHADSVGLWAVARPSIVARGVKDFSLSPDGRFYVTESQAGVWWDVVVYDAITGTELARLGVDGMLRHAAFSRDGAYLATLGIPEDSPPDAQLWESQTGKMVTRADLMTDWTEFGVWDTTTARRLLRFGVLSLLRPSADGRFFTTARADSIDIWAVDTDRRIAALSNREEILDSDFSPNGDLLAIATADGRVRVVSTADGRDVTALTHNLPVRAVAFGPDGRYLAALTDDQTVSVWDLAGRDSTMRYAHSDSLIAFAFGPDGHTLATATQGSRGGALWFWPPETLIAEACRRLPRNLTRAEWTLYLPDDRYRATCPNLPPDST